MRFNSKMLKPGNRWDRLEKMTEWRRKLAEWWDDCKIMKWYRKVRLFVRRLKRVYLWSKNCLWTNWDFDAHSIFPLLEYKLKRIQFCLENGTAWQDPKDMKALRIAIKLAKRIGDTYHEDKLYDWHEKKWGGFPPWKTSWKDNEDGTSTYVGHRVNVKTPEDREAESADLRVLWEKEVKWRQRDEKLLFAIIQKHYQLWWD